MEKPATLGERISYSFRESMQLLVDILKGTIVAIVAVLPFSIILLLILAVLWYFHKNKKKS